MLQVLRMHLVYSYAQEVQRRAEAHSFRLSVIRLVSLLGNECGSFHHAGSCSACAQTHAKSRHGVVNDLPVSGINGMPRTGPLQVLSLTFWRASSSTSGST